MPDTESRALSLSVRCYRRLLRAYPQAFLTEFEDLLCQAFGDLAHRAIRTKGHRGLLVLWIRMIPDLISSALSQRFHLNSNWRFRLRWMTACTIGAVSGATLMIVVGHWVDKIQIGRGIQVFPRTEQSFQLLVLQFAATFGFILGCFQSLAFRWNACRRVVWVFLTMLGVTFSVDGVLMVPIIRATLLPFVDQHGLLFYLGAIAICASPMGMLQALVFAKRHSRSLAWIPVSAVGIIACGFLLGTVTPILTSVVRIRGQAMLFGTIGLIVGIVYGLLTVLPLEWILQPRESQEVSSKSLS